MILPQFQKGKLIHNAVFAYLNLKFFSNLAFSIKLAYKFIRTICIFDEFCL